MPSYRFILPLTLAAIGAAADPEPLAALAKHAHAGAANGDASVLSELETVLRLTTDPSSAIAQQAERDYWTILRTSGDYPRAYSFYSSLTRERPKSAEVHGCAGSATGGYIGWLFQHGMPEAARDLKHDAEAEFDQALALDPANFTALFGVAIYDSYAPDRQQRRQDDLARLKAATGGKPEREAMVADLERMLAPAKP